MKRRLWIVAVLTAAACGGEGVAGPEPGPMMRNGSERRLAAYEVDPSDGTPIYPEGTVGHWVDAGTWLKIYQDAGFVAQGQYSIYALMHTAIRGNSSTGWSASSDDGLHINLGMPTQFSRAYLTVPAEYRDCQASTVTLSGHAEHTAKYKVAGAIGGVSGDATWTDSRESRHPDVTCEHEPLDGQIVGPNFLFPGESATLAVYWHFRDGPDTCPTVWTSQSPVTLSNPQGIPDVRLATAQYVGTARVTATCHGLTATWDMTIGRDSLDAPPPGGGWGGSGEGSGDDPPFSPAPTGESIWVWPSMPSGDVVRCHRMEVHYRYRDGSVSASWYFWQCSDGTQWAE